VTAGSHRFSFLAELIQVISQRRSRRHFSLFQNLRFQESGEIWSYRKSVWFAEALMSTGSLLEAMYGKIEFGVQEDRE
jgi:hypothetical protein